MTVNSPLLGIEKSISGQRWELREGNERESLALCQRFSLPDIVGRILSARGIGLDQAEDFLNPSLKTLLPDPSHLVDMDKAINHLVGEIQSGNRIAVFGDYDVDGATSSAVLKRYFNMLGLDMGVYIPDRMSEGYGPNLPALMKLKEQGYSTVITVDCGITAFDVLGKASKSGLNMVVMDHHAAEAHLPDAIAVVNPNRLDDASPHGHMAAVGVVFLLVVGLNRALRDVGFFGDKKEPDIRLLLDLVALGTVCDVVPLKGVNRAFVSQGLKVMAGRRNTGMKALADVSAVDGPPSAYHLGFQMGPRVNAGGRVGEAALGSRLLASDTPQEALAIARQLDGFNAERKEIEAACLEQAIEMVEREGREKDSLIYVASEGWHAGVIGIVASRLKERYGAPACVVAIENGVGKGSGRSVDGVDLGAHVIAAHQSDLLLNGGGHKMAAGFTVTEALSDEFRDYLNERISKQVSEMEMVPTLTVDGCLQASGATIDLVKTLDQLAPFGAGNATPKFVLENVKIIKPRIVGADHVSCQVSSSGGGNWIKAIAFRCADQNLGDLLLSANHGLPVHLAGRLQIDSWQGRDSVQIMIEDAAPA
ncbi:single-stranded-DNA-specific exonuclease RecJ [Curvivirga aplysinae]|uniref:single-stranded-DNA-specific exonuclease RecJ n=1 Tax=Curvivirga aplysinae TaxID=2529852 RepID=UPI0012BB79E1|nr:single-stranded-DNA-specific exonuclease RecJ [Curvivirga aplysinae]MTI09372.1 single-stranded-DNA-specific exonuclease RecJ [Curvivirga aplysinae]